MKKATTIFMTVVSVLGVYCAIDMYLNEQKKARAESEVAGAAAASPDLPSFHATSELTVNGRSAEGEFVTGRSGESTDSHSATRPAVRSGNAAGTTAESSTTAPSRQDTPVDGKEVRIRIDTDSCGWVTPGMRVDVLDAGMLESPGHGPVIAQNARVLTVENGSARHFGMATLLVEAQDAALLQRVARNKSVFHLVVRGQAQAEGASLSILEHDRKDSEPPPE